MLSDEKIEKKILIITMKVISEYMKLQKRFYDICLAKTEENLK